MWIRTKGWRPRKTPWPRPGHCAELAAEDPTLRQTLREQLWNHGFLQTELVEEAEEAQTFLMYADYREPVRTLPSHRVLAINRGEKKGCLKVHLVWDEQQALRKMEWRVLRRPCIYRDQLKEALADSWKRLLFPAWNGKSAAG